jgi:hypothetical protein
MKALVFLFSNSITIHELNKQAHKHFCLFRFHSPPFSDYYPYYPKPSSNSNHVLSPATTSISHKPHYKSHYKSHYKPPLFIHCAPPQHTPSFPSTPLHQFPSPRPSPQLINLQKNNWIATRPSTPPRNILQSLLIIHAFFITN